MNKEIMIYIKKLEKSLNVTLPEEYKKLLLNVEQYEHLEGGTIEFVENGIEQSTNIMEFSMAEDLEFFYENLYEENLIPEKYISIATDDFDNDFLLCLDNNNYGKVYFGNHETRNEKNQYNLSLIANSFNEFLAKVKPEQ